MSIGDAIDIKNPYFDQKLASIIEIIEIASLQALYLSTYPAEIFGVKHESY